MNSVHDDGHPYGQGRKNCPDCAAATQVGRLARLATLSELLVEAYEYGHDVDIPAVRLNALGDARQVVEDLRDIAGVS